MIAAFAIAIYAASLFCIDKGGRRLPWDCRSQEDGGPGTLCCVSLRFTLIVAVSISVFDFLTDFMYFTVTLLGGGGPALGYETYPLLVLSILMLTLPSTVYASVLGFPRAFMHAWIQEVFSFPQHFLRHTFGTSSWAETRKLIHDPRTVGSESRIHGKFILFRLVELSYSDDDWCRSMERATCHVLCWALFISSALLSLVGHVVFAVLKLLIFWPPSVLVCLMLGMNLRLFVVFPAFLTWVRMTLIRQRGRRKLKCVHPR